MTTPIPFGWGGPQSGVTGFGGGGGTTFTDGAYGDAQLFPWGSGDTSQINPGPTMGPSNLMLNGRQAGYNLPSDYTGPLLIGSTRSGPTEVHTDPQEIANFRDRQRRSAYRGVGTVASIVGGGALAGSLLGGAAGAAGGTGSATISGAPIASFGAAAPSSAAIGAETALTGGAMGFGGAGAAGGAAGAGAGAGAGAAAAGGGAMGGILGNPNLGRIVTAGAGLLGSLANRPDFDTPDYRGAAEETAASQERMLAEQIRANRPNQTTPWGSSTWEQDPATGQWRQSINLSPNEQSSLDSQQRIQQGRSNMAEGLLGRSQQEFGSPMDWGQFDSYMGMDADTDAVRSRNENAVYGKLTSRLDPRFSQKREQQEAQLRNQGLRPGDEAYDTAMENLGREETDAYGQAGMDSTIYGGLEAERSQNMSAQASGFNNQIRQAKIAEEMQRRGFSLNEINAIISGQQVGLPQMPNFSQAGRTGGTNYTGAAQDQYGAEMDNFSARNAWLNSLMNGAGDMAMHF